MQGTGDNWDFRMMAHDMRRNNQNRDVHYFASNLIFERVPVPPHLSDVTPKRDIRKMPNSFFLLNDKEAMKLREDYKVLVARVLIEFLPFLNSLKAVVPKHINHPYINEMSQKSVIVPMPILMKDEKKYSDVVDILCFYEDSLEEIYVEAGIAMAPTNTNKESPPDAIETAMQSLPDQPYAHRLKQDEVDHMSGISVPFGGDQMTRVRFAGAKDLRAGAHTAKDRFDHCSPFIGELWHTKMSFLQYVYNRLYNSASIRDVGTMKFFREKYARKNVTPTKVSDSYEGCEQFLLSVGNAYIVEAALEFWGMNDIRSSPTRNIPPNNLRSIDAKNKYYDEVIGAFVEHFAIIDTDVVDIKPYESMVSTIKHDHNYAVPSPSETTNASSQAPDRVRYYGLDIIELTVFLMQLIDTAAEGDGIRSNINRKRLMLYFKSSNNFSKYALEMFTSIAQLEAIMSEKLAHRVSWGRFVNWNGGVARNIEADLAQEICNKQTKDVVWGMGANKTEKSIVRASKAAAGVKQIIEQFDKSTVVEKSSVVHTAKSAKEDEISMMDDLRNLRPFIAIPGRAFGSFKNLSISLTSDIDMKGLYRWLETHKHQIGLGQLNMA